MSDTVKKINAYFKNANRADVDNLLSKIILSDRQSKIFEMFYLKRYGIDFIADDVCVSPTVISEELKLIRCKISAFIQ